MREKQNIEVPVWIATVFSSTEISLQHKKKYSRRYSAGIVSSLVHQLFTTKRDETTYKGGISNAPVIHKREKNNTSGFERTWDR